MFGFGETNTKPTTGGRKRVRKSARSSKNGRKVARMTKKRRRKRGGSAIATASLPFSLLAIQQFFKTRKGRKNLKKASRTLSKTSRKLTRSR